MTDKPLDFLRLSLQEKDRMIVKLLNHRAELSIAIGKCKQDEKLPIFDPAREAIIYDNIKSINDGPLSDDDLKAVYREILSSSRKLQKKLAVVYLGPEASFTSMASRRYFGSSPHFYPVATIIDVFEEVERKRADCGVVPIENSLEGTVKVTLDRLMSTDLRIMGEIFFPVSHCLLSSGSSIDSLARVYSHPQALAQCRQWIRENLAHCTIHETDSTAEAARRAADEPTWAAIASREAGELYGLTALASSIEDYRLNVTRFLVIGSMKTSVTGRDKTSLIFTIRHEPGSLLRSLTPFAEAGLNLTRIVSHPIKERAWEYRFFVDFLGHVDEERVVNCLDRLGKECTFVKVLGSYPAEETAS